MTTYLLTIPGRLPGLNEYINASRSHAQEGGRFKKRCQELVCWHVLRCLHNRTIDRPVYLKFTWYEQDKRRDLDNVSSFGRKIIQDALVTSGVLHDDGWGYVVGYSDKFYVDKENPRIEVQIIEQEGTVKTRHRNGGRR